MERTLRKQETKERHEPNSAALQAVVAYRRAGSGDQSLAKNECVDLF
jgi:hypothetical protein